MPVLAQAVRFCGGCLAAFGVWTLWLALVLLLAAQVYVLTTEELTVPGFVIRRLEARLAESGLGITFSQAAFDPTGRVLLENPRVSLPAFAEPVLTARTLYVTLNPWPLVVGRFEPREIRITGATAAVPAMLSPTGQADEILHDLDATLAPGDKVFTIHQLSARVGDMPVSVHGSFRLPPAHERNALPVAELLRTRFPALCRQALALAEQLAAFDTPSVELAPAPSESGLAIVQVNVLARGLNLTSPLVAQGRNIHFRTRIHFLGDAPASRLEFTAEELQLPFETTARGVRALVLGRLRTDGFQFEPRELDLTAESVAASGVSARAVVAQFFPRPLPRLDAIVAAQILGAPLAIQAEADFATRSARLHFDGSISPAVLDLFSQRFGVNVRRYFDFAALECANGAAQFGANWKFERVAARVAVPRANAYGVTLEDGQADVELEGSHFHSPDASARIGENFARGSYDHELKTHQYRFLLAGRLRPLAISPWFREWWPDFFRQFEFPTVAPFGSVDVSGYWREGHRSTVFVFADADRPIARGAAFDRLRTRLFIRPAFFDGLEVLAAREGGTVRGRFTYTADPATNVWRALDLNLDSTLDLGVAAQVLGPVGTSILSQFKIAAPPTLHLEGRLEGAGMAAPPHQLLTVQTRAAGGFRFRDFPLQDVSFKATLRDDEIVLDDGEAIFASGAVSGHARVWGAGDQRRLGFDCALKDASFGQVAAALQEFLALQQHRAPTPPGKFVQEKASVRLDFAASAEGRFDNPLTYHGDGSAVLRGAEIGEVPLLGQLSELLKFTALRFTEARGNFKIEGPKLVFPIVTLRGANSAVDGHGEYALDRHELDFKAKVFPFQESDNLLKSVVGAVLTPLSNALEVKLSGTLEKPEWAFVIGPTNLLRALGPASPESSPRSDSPPAVGRPPAEPVAPAASPAPKS